MIGQKTIRAVLLAAVAALAGGAVAVGCGSRNKGSANAQSTSTQATTSASPLDNEYLKTSIEGDAFEVQGGKIALKKTSNPKVKKLAKTLIKDHSKSLKESMALAKRFGVTVSGSPSPPEQWELQSVQTRSGTDFDHWYALLEVDDHKQDIDDASTESQSGGSSDVVANAQKELPQLRMHLKLSQAALH